jgi:putative ATPase
MDLFETMNPQSQSGPLAERLRPKDLVHFQGQAKVLKALGPWLNQPESAPNLIFWGPPGSGKTTLARLLASKAKKQFISLHANDTGAKEIRTLGEGAHRRKIEGHGATLLFIDEIHRLNRGQQDVLLPFMEAGDITLIGATTENPSYELNAALLSRSQVIVFEALPQNDLSQLLARAAEALGSTPSVLFTPEGIQALLTFADGDARKLLNAVEMLAPHRNSSSHPLTPDVLADLLQNPTVRYDKNHDEHYDCISAFIKSVRGSDADAAIYYLARMLAGGEDPVFVARRLVILASEDIGNADPRAISLAIAGLQAVELVGMPEAAISLAQVTTYLSSAPKSNASYQALRRAQEVVKRTGTLPIPLALRSARTKLAKELGYGEDYKYAHQGPTGWQEMSFLPEPIEAEKFYEPTERGFEKTIRTYLDWMKGRPKP